MNSVQYIKQAFADSIRTKQNAAEKLTEPLAQAADIALSSLNDGGKMMICGNGGSAADAQHFAAELVGRFEAERRGLAAIALTTDTSAITAIANDIDYNQIFARQITALGSPADVLIAISTSGNSPNVIQAIHAAHASNLRVIALTGANGGGIRTLLKAQDVLLCVPADNTARIQEVHILLLHCLCGIIERRIAQ